jgi:two-component system OmpR family response regulator
VPEWVDDFDVLVLDAECPEVLAEPDVPEEPQAAISALSSADAEMAVSRRFMAAIVRPRHETVLKAFRWPWEERPNTPHMSPSPRLLVLEDDSRLQEVMVRALRAEGFAVSAVRTAHQLLERVGTSVPDAFVIDIGVPDADGRDVCQALRARGIETPVLFLTARDTLADRLAGFHAGGDDYVTKPFDIEEVVVRLRALVRRAGIDVATELSGFEFDPSDRTVRRNGAAIEVTPTEFRLLAALAGRRGKALTREELIRSAWPHGAIVHDNTLDVYMARLRKKLRSFPDPPRVATVHGTGYRLE